jgi:hypothetical protein
VISVISVVVWCSVIHHKQQLELPAARSSRKIRLIEGVYLSDAQNPNPPLLDKTWQNKFVFEVCEYQAGGQTRFCHRDFSQNNGQQAARLQQIANK